MILACSVLIGAFVNPLVCNAADTRLLVFKYGDFVNEFKFSANFNGVRNANTDPYYSGILDVYVPFNLFTEDSQPIDSPNRGDYHVSTAWGHAYLTLASFGQSDRFGLLSGSLSLLSASIVNSSGSSAATVFPYSLSVNGVTSDSFFSPVSQYQYSTNSAVWDLNVSFSDYDLHFVSYYSENLFLHLRLNADNIYLDPTVNFIIDYSDIIFKVSSLKFISDKSVSGEIQDVEGAVKGVDDTLKKEHQEEVDKADQAGGTMASSLTNVTNTLSSIEILKLPWTMLTDLYNALNGFGYGGFVFPSFSLMGYQIWPAYEVDFAELDSRFSTLFESVRLASGFILCFSFANYLRSFFVKVFGSGESDGD